MKQVGTGGTMAVKMNIYPILDFDPDSPEVIKPNHSIEGLQLPEKCVYPFLGDIIDRFAASHKAACVETLHTITKDYPIYVVEYKGEEITLCQAPLGASAAAQSMDSLIACGVKKIVCAGSCGALADLPENVFMVPIKALRDEGTSYHYLHPSRYVEPDPEIVRSIESVLTRNHIPYEECMTWTTDGFFRETKDMIEYRKKEGCSVVEMECSALAACAKRRGAQFGQLLFTADTLADSLNYDAREWGASSFEKALSLLFEIALEM